MEESKSPEDCNRYPTCKHLKVLFEVQGSFSAYDEEMVDEIVFPRDAKPICRQCEDFEAKKDKVGKSDRQE